MFPLGFLLLGRECGTKEALRLKGGGVSLAATSALAWEGQRWPQPFPGIAPDRTSNSRESDFHNPKRWRVGEPQTQPLKPSPMAQAGGVRVRGVPGRGRRARLPGGGKRSRSDRGTLPSEVAQIEAVAFAIFTQQSLEFEDLAVARR